MALFRISSILVSRVLIAEATASRRLSTSAISAAGVLADAARPVVDVKDPPDPGVYVTAVPAVAAEMPLV